MDITKYPQFELRLLTLNLLNLKTQILPQNCDEGCVNATIINRAFLAHIYFANCGWTMKSNLKYWSRGSLMMAKR